MDAAIIDEYRTWREAGSLQAVVSGNRPAAATDHGRAEDAMRSTNPLICMEGCYYLLAASAPSPQLLDTVERLVEDEASVRGNLLLAMGALPLQCFVERPKLLRCVLTAAMDRDTALNAAILVGELAGSGHTEALEVFKQLREGADKDVARNAQISFEQAQAANQAADDSPQ